MVPSRVSRLRSGESAQRSGWNARTSVDGPARLRPSRSPFTQALSGLPYADPCPPVPARLAVAVVRPPTWCRQVPARVINPRECAYSMLRTPRRSVHRGVVTRQHASLIPGSRHITYCARLGRCRGGTLALGCLRPSFGTLAPDEGCPRIRAASDRTPAEARREPRQRVGRRRRLTKVAHESGQVSIRRLPRPKGGPRRQGGKVGA